MARSAVPAPSRLAGRLVAGVALAALVGFPLFDLARELIGAGSSRINAAIDSAAFTPMVNTVWTAFAATAVTLVLAIAIATTSAEFGSRGRLAVLVGMVLPILVPPFVSALSWVAAYGEGGFIDDLGGPALPGLFGPFGVVLLLVVSALPIAYLIVAAALESRRERDLVRAARVSGAGPRTAASTVTIPLLRPALVAAGAVTFIMSTNAFGVPAVLGTPARFTTTTTRLYQDLVLSADPVAFDRVLVLAGFLVLVTFAAVGIADAGPRAPLRLRVEPSGPGIGSGGSRRAAWLIGTYVIVTTGLPLVAIVLRALTRAVGLPPVPGNWTTSNFDAALDAGAVSAFSTSALLAVAAATGAVALGGLLVALERRRRTGAGTVAALAFAVPGSVLAVAVLLAYGPWLRDTVLLILIAYLAKFWALGHRPIAGSAAALSPELFNAARVAGATAPAAVRTIVVPLLRPALVAAWLVVFIFGLHELTMSSLLRGPGIETIAVAVLDIQQLGDQAVTAALAVLLTAAALVCAAPLLWLWRRVPRGSAG